MMLLSIVMSLVAMSVMAIIVYLYILGLIGIRVFHAGSHNPESTGTKFLVIIPAHNEEGIIRDVIDSIRATNYDQGMIDIVAVADNCTDSTAQSANHSNTIVLERNDLNLLGKGYAIEWVFSRIDINNYDAVTVIDADNIVEKNFFKVTSGLLESGKDVVQTYYGFYNVSKTSYSYILYLANLMENFLLYNSRSSINLHTFLRGSGMTFKPRLLHEIPWQSDSITEDVNYSIKLISSGKKIHFTTNTRVYEEALRYINQSFNQRLRYNSGIINLFRDNFIQLIIAGIKQKNLLLMEASISFFLLSKPMLLALSVMILAISLIFNLSDFISIVSLLNIAALFLYNILGVFLKPEKGPLFKALLISPFFAIWLVVVYILSSLGYKKGVWSRTPRVSKPSKHPPVL